MAPGCVIVVHAAAGGVGKLLGRWAAHLGAVVIGTVGSEAKEAVAAANGCRHVINYAHADFAVEVKRLTEGRGPMWCTTPWVRTPSRAHCKAWRCSGIW